MSFFHSLFEIFYIIIIIIFVFCYC
jgi:hypothetical protein